MAASRKIIIAGAGVGGLFSAAALARAGMDVTVVERAAALTEVGAGIQVSPNGSRLLRRIDALTEVERDAFQPEAAEMRLGESGGAILHMPLGAAAEARWGAPYLQVHRADLLRALERAARAAGAEIRLGASVETVETVGDCARVVLEGGEVLTADIAIGADGVRSRLRALLFGEGAPRFTGQTAWRGLVAADALPPGLVHPTATVWVGPGRHLVTYFLRRGALVNFVAVVERPDWAEEDWSVRGDLEALRGAFAGWASGASQVLEAATECWLWGLFDRPPPPAWRKGRVVLLGDACHPMLPFMAQGATQAFEDGAVLAAVLSQEGDVDPALAAYESRRRARAARVQAVSRGNARLFHARSPAERFVRYGPIALGSRVAPSAAMARLDWLYGYDAAA